MRGAKTVQLEKSMALCVQTADALLSTQRQENQKWRSVCSCFDSSIENSKVETGWKPQYRHSSISMVSISAIFDSVLARPYCIMQFFSADAKIS